jgi:hypothetical protein
MHLPRKNELLKLIGIPWALWLSQEVYGLGKDMAKVKLAVFGIAAVQKPATPPRAPAGGEQLAFPVPNFPTRKETRHDEGTR